MLKYAVNLYTYNTTARIVTKEGSGSECFKQANTKLELSRFQSIVIMAGLTVHIRQFTASLEGDFKQRNITKQLIMYIISINVNKASTVYMWYCLE